MGEIPLDTAIRESGDAGRPVVLADPDSSAAAPFVALADALAERCGASGGGDDDEQKKGFLGGLFNR
jgi:ATP-binding protein involved in chromosome partitioning